MIRVPASSRGIRRIPFLEAFLEGTVLPTWLPPDRTRQSRWLGWGSKNSATRAGRCARAWGGEVWRLEDGFLRSFGPGDSFPTLSLVLDDRGIYYDANRPSALEELLNSPRDLLAGIADDVARARSLITRHRLGKYNHAPALAASCLREGDHQRVLVIDQTRDDMSVTRGHADADTFARMLFAARREHPRATIYVKTHPEVTSGRKKGYLTRIRDDHDTVVLRHPVNPISLLERMDHVYTVTSTMGFEALLAGKQVTAFGMPWYAGWGVTDDRQTCPRRVRTRTVDELFAGAYFHYTRYLDPVTRRRGTLFDVIDWMIRQQEVETGHHGRMICVSFPAWRSAHLGPIMSLDPARVVFARTPEAADALEPTSADRLLWWGADVPATLLELAARSRATVVRVEDGFVRSVGLGSDLIRPLSVVMDERGMHFDPSRPSDLERILATTDFTTEELARAERVRKYIVAHGITKYNLEPREKAPWHGEGKEIVLVVGQVEDDASIRHGCTAVSTNRALLRAARDIHPDAFIVFKPHPDVHCGGRAGAIAAAELGMLADHVESRLSVVSCIEACDVVHTMTSLSGFDALLRGKRVVVHGQPFYAGWGLTTDLCPDGSALARRGRRLRLDELVAGALLRHPVYWDWELKGYTNCEAALRRVVESRASLEKAGRLQQLGPGFVRRSLRRLGAVWRGMVYRATHPSAP